MASVTPPSSYVPPAQGSGASAPVDGQAVEADVQSLPPSLQSTDRALNLRGQVQGVNDDGSVRIATPRGPVDVQLPQPLPPKGTEVEVDVPAGSPPRTVTVTVPQPPASTPPASTPPVQTPSVPTPQLPPQTQSLPGTPAPQTPPPASGSSGPPVIISTPPASQTPVQQTPTAQTPGAPQTQFPAPQPGIPANAQATIPAQSTIPPQTPAPAPGHALPGVPLLQEAALPTPPPGLSPQGLLDFLKNSLQTLLKTPVTNAQNAPATNANPLPGNPAPNPAPNLAPNLASVSQRPLQLGQWVRLTPLPAGQTPLPVPQTPTQAQTLPQLRVPIPSLQNLLSAQVPPGAAPALKAAPLVPPASSPLIALLKSVLPQAASVQITLPGAPQAAANAQTIDPVLKLLLPLNLNTAAAAPPAAGTLPLLTAQLTLPDHAPLLLQALPGAQIITAAPGAPQMMIPQTMDVRINALLPVIQQAILQNPAAANLVHGTPASPVLFASVTGQTQQGLPILSLPTFTLAPDGTPKAGSLTLVLQFPAKGLGAESILKFDLLPGAHAAGTAPQAQAAAALGDAVSWESLDDILRALPAQMAANAQSAAAITAALPKPGAAAFTAPVLMFVAALRGGDITGWMGDKGLEAVRTGRKADLLSRLSADFSQSVRRLSADDARPAGEWKSLNLPMLYGGDLARVHLHYKSFERESDGPGQSKKQTGTRFIMDIALNRMGPMQIDGFSIGKKLDVTLRSEQSLSPGMREAMRERYHNAVANIGFSGELNFNASPDHKGWVVLDSVQGFGRAGTATA